MVAFKGMACSARSSRNDADIFAGDDLSVDHIAFPEHVTPIQTLAEATSAHARGFRYTASLMPSNIIPAVPEMDYADPVTVEALGTTG